MVDKRIEAKAYAHEWGTDLPEIADWLWPDAGDAVGEGSSAFATGGDNE
jgi:xylulose-5-phosphate/fructose-6-phosphate phosphoketolase